MIVLLICEGLSRIFKNISEETANGRLVLLLFTLGLRSILLLLLSTLIIAHNVVAVARKQEVFMRIQLVERILGRHFLQVVMHDCVFALLHLQRFNILIEQWLEGLDCIRVHLKVHEAMVEDGVAVCDLAVEFSI